jgi:hypothetical protein
MLGAMRSRYRVNEPHAAYFITCTIVAWLPVFTSASRCDILVESFQYCRKNKGKGNRHLFSSRDAKKLEFHL